MTEAQLQVLLNILAALSRLVLALAANQWSSASRRWKRKWKSFGYRGVWSEQQPDYRVGNFVTHQSWLWHCNCAGTSAYLGTLSHWTLAVSVQAQRTLHYA